MKQHGPAMSRAGSVRGPAAVLCPHAPCPDAIDLGARGDEGVGGKFFYYYWTALRDRERLACVE